MSWPCVTKTVRPSELAAVDGCGSCACGCGAVAAVGAVLEVVGLAVGPVEAGLV